MPFRCEARATANTADAPLMILMNKDTRGAAEVLAERVARPGPGNHHRCRHRRHGARLARPVVERRGACCCVATAKIALPKGYIFPGGVAPDVPVKINAQIEGDIVLNFGDQRHADCQPHCRADAQNDDGSRSGEISPRRSV
ncbi:MAG: hypothetical protein MZV49_05460 [Rhodopseudomonas palustris]|nr:hypothetical protein [Rhodopseudomonas palustris]